MINFKLELACSKDEMRPSINYIKTTRDNIQCTNAHIACMIPTEYVFDEEFIRSISDEGILIHNEDFKKMRGYDYFVLDGKYIKCKHSKKRDFVFEYETELNVGKFPMIEQVIPDRNTIEPMQLDSIGINADYLKNIQDALGFSGLRLTFFGSSKAILINHSQKDCEYPDAFGIMMPLMLI